MDSAAYANQAVKGIKKSFDNAMTSVIEKYMTSGYIQYYSTSEVSEIFTSTESMGGVTELGELQTPPSMKLEDGYSVTISEKRFGGAIVIPETVYRREGKDTTYKVDEFLKRQRNLLLRKNKLKMMTNAHLMLNEAFDSTSVYLAPDSVEVCGSHSWNSGGTFDNGVTDLLDEDAYDTAWEYAGAMTDPDGEQCPLNWTHIVVKKGSANHKMALQLFAKEIKPTAINDINVYEGMLTVIETPYITTTNKNYWFLMDLSQEVSPLAVGIGEMPTLREPIKETNEGIRTNCTGFWKQGCNNMSWNMYGSDGTT